MPRTRPSTSSRRRACSTEVVFPADVRVDTWVERGTEVSAALRPDAGQADRPRQRPRRTRWRALSRALERHAHRRRRNQPRLPARRHGLRARSREGQPHDPQPGRLRARPAAPSTCSSAGVQTTVQDWPGRTRLLGRRRAASGPMDALALRLANRLVGNAEGAAALEITVSGPDAAASLRRCCVAVAGAPIELHAGRRSGAAACRDRVHARAARCASARVQARRPRLPGGAAAASTCRPTWAAAPPSRSGSSAATAAARCAPATCCTWASRPKPAGCSAEQAARAGARLRHALGHRRALRPARRARLLHARRHRDASSPPTGRCTTTPAAPACA